MYLYINTKYIFILLLFYFKITFPNPMYINSYNNERFFREDQDSKLELFNHEMPSNFRQAVSADTIYNRRVREDRMEKKCNDERTKKAATVVENSPNGQIMYDLSNWKTNKDNPSFDDQYSQSHQEQFINLMYPVEQLERNYNKKQFEKMDIAQKTKRNAEVIKQNDQVAKSDLKLSGPVKRKTESNCPPHNNPASGEKENLNDKDTVKRETTAKWSKEQISALTNSLLKAQENSNELDTVKAILNDMGLGVFPQKRSIINEASLTKSSTSNNNQNSIDKVVAAVAAQSSETKRDLVSSGNKKDDEDMNASKRNERLATNDDKKLIVNIGEASQENLKKRGVDSVEISNDLHENIKKEGVKTSVVDVALIAENNNNLSQDKNNKVSRKKRQEQQLVKQNSEREKEKRKSEDDEYERQVESQIQTKIDALKEKVKREILEEQKKMFRSSRIRRDLINNDSKYSRNNLNLNEPERETIYRANQGDQEEQLEDEDNEFDDGYDGRIYMEKRQSGDEDEQITQDFTKDRSRRSYEDYGDDNEAFHGGSRKSALKNKALTERQKRKEITDNDNKDNEKLDDLNNNPDSEYFGSLPQNYNGEVTRYKRIKRDNPYK